MRESALLYFIISAVFIAGVLAAYGLLKKLPVIKYFERLKRERDLEPDVVADGEVGSHQATTAISSLVIATEMADVFLNLHASVELPHGVRGASNCKDAAAD
jgi:hypothetical protein